MPLVPVTPVHAAAMAALHAAAMPAGEAWDAAAMASLLALAGTFGLADDGCGMVLARVAADEAEILALAVHPQRRRQGRGARLLAAAEQTAAAAGAACMYLEVAERNLTARALYRAAGYELTGRRRSYYSDGGTALVLHKALPG